VPAYSLSKIKGLKEMPCIASTPVVLSCFAVKSSQQVAVVGSTAYVPQAPFILGGTVRDNILFGRPYEEERYRIAVQAAQLEADLAQLQAGDMTELGEWRLRLGSPMIFLSAKPTCREAV
jgi:ABC-type transport system involved in cytochrome bd biosynthesis fused ATPase/permease subunit